MKAEISADPIAWTPWPVSWTAVFVGALTALASALILGLVGTAVGATGLKAGSSWHSISRLDVAMAVIASFFAFAAGGWVAAKIAGARYAEPSILHAAVAWLIALPLLIVMLAAGSGSAFGGWYGGLVTVAGAAVASPASPEAARATALTGLAAILIGLIGTVIGGWAASGEPMTLTHYRTRKPFYAPPARRTPS